MSKYKGKYKVVAKNADYGYDHETGVYGEHDLVVKTNGNMEGLSEALGVFLANAIIGDYDQDVEVTMTFTYNSAKFKGKNK